MVEGASFSDVRRTPDADFLNLGSRFESSNYFEKLIPVTPLRNKTSLYVVLMIGIGFGVFSVAGETRNRGKPRGGSPVASIRTPTWREQPASRQENC